MQRLLAAARRRGSPAGEISPVEQFRESEPWNLVRVDYFLDGGSVALSFLGRDGEILHLWAEQGIPRRCFLKRTYNDPSAVEVESGSDLEKRVLTLLSNCRVSDQAKAALEPLPKLCAALLRDRSALPAIGWPGVQTRELLMPAPSGDSR